MLWRDVIDEIIRDGNGLATRQQLLRGVPTPILDSHVSRQRLQRVYPHVYAARSVAVTADLRLRAALVCVGGEAGISHTTALQVWGLRSAGGPVHVTIDASRRRAGAPDLRVHRRSRFHAAELAVVRGLPITPVARSIVDSWPLLPLAERRPLAIDAVRVGRTTTAALRDALGERPNVGGHRALAQTVELVTDGCQSELEAMGVLSVFRHRSLPRSVGQYRVTLLDGRTVHLDRSWPAVKLAVELDGARFHTNPEDRRRDLARDAAMAALGWVVLRFTYADVLRDPDRVRAVVLAAHATRRAQLLAG